MRFSRQEYWSRLPCPLPRGSSRGSSPPREQTHVSYISCTGKLEGGFLYFVLFCFFYHWCHPGSWVLCSSIDMTFSGTIRIDLENRFMVAGAWGWECYARCPNPRAGREKASKTMQLAKRELYCWLESGLLPHSTQWFGVREPRAQAVTQIYRVSISSW